MRTGNLGSDDYRIHRDMVALPFYHLAISINKSHIQTPLPPPETIGDHIRQIRTKKKLFQREVAQIIGVKTSTLENWERNRTKPLLEKLPRIFDFLGYVPEHYRSSKRLQSPIFQYRAKHGLGVKVMADLLGVDKSTIFSWETGRITMSGENWFKFKSLI